MAWLKDCEICNTGLCKTVDELKEQGLREAVACKQMSDESKGLYSAGAILQRYLWHTGRKGKKLHNVRNDEGIANFFQKAKSLARLAQKLKQEVRFEEHKPELLKAASAVLNVLTETREGMKWG